MPSALGKITRLAAFAGIGYAAAIVPSFAADPVGREYSRATVYQTTHVTRTYAVQECGLLRITDPNGSRIVEVCHPPVF